LNGKEAEAVGVLPRAVAQAAGKQQQGARREQQPEEAEHDHDLHRDLWGERDAIVARMIEREVSGMITAHRMGDMSPAKLSVTVPML
jgi:hypothetical protein